MTGLVSTFSIDDAEVRTSFSSDTVRPAEKTDLEIAVNAGDAGGQLEDIRFGIAATFVGEKRNPYSDHAPPEYGEVVEELDEVQVVDRVEYGADETVTREATVTIPPRTPLTRGDVRVSVQTGLAINWSVEPENPTDLTVEPTGQMDDVMEALEELGFVYRQMDCSRDRYRGFRQELEFEPTAGPFFGQMDELQIFFEPSEDELLVEFLPTEGMWDDESHGGKWHEISFSDEDVEAVTDELESEIEKHA